MWASRVRSDGGKPSFEGLAIFACVAYETVGIIVNVLAGRRVIPLITDILGPLTHKKYFRIITWLFLGFWWNHFYERGCSEHICSECGLTSSMENA